MGWTVRSYLWKGTPFCTVYWDNTKLGTLQAAEDLIDRLVNDLPAQHIRLGEVRQESMKIQGEYEARRKAAHLWPRPDATEHRYDTERLDFEETQP